MNGFVRQLAALSVLWSLCELVLPDGKQQQMVRMTVSVLVMTALLGSMGRMLSGSVELPAWSVQIHQTGTQSYQQTALTALASQVENWCVRRAQRAGYQAAAVVWVTQTGALEKIEMTLSARQPPLITPGELRSQLAEALQINPEQIRLSEGS